MGDGAGPRPLFFLSQKMGGGGEEGGFVSDFGLWIRMGTNRGKLVWEMMGFVVDQKGRGKIEG